MIWVWFESRFCGVRNGGMVLGGKVGKVSQFSRYFYQNCWISYPGPISEIGYNQGPYSLYISYIGGPLHEKILYSNPSNFVHMSICTCVILYPFLSK